MNLSIVSLLLMVPPTLAQTNNTTDDDDGIPVWEIGLAAGSGAIALIICFFAVMTARNKDKTKEDDVETGKKTSSTATQPAGRAAAPSAPAGRAAAPSAPAGRAAAPSAPPDSKAVALAKGFDSSVEKVVTLAAAVPAAGIETAGRMKNVATTAVASAKEALNKSVERLQETPESVEAEKVVRKNASERAKKMNTI